MQQDRFPSVQEHIDRGKADPGVQAVAEVSCAGCKILRTLPPPRRILFLTRDNTYRRRIEVHEGGERVELFWVPLGELFGKFHGNRRSFGDFEIDFETLQVKRAGELIHLTPTEFSLLHTLILHRNLPLSRSKLIKSLWGYDSDISSDRTIDVHIRHLRSKLEEDPARPRWIITVRGFGYKFQP